MALLDDLKQQAQLVVQKQDGTPGLTNEQFTLVQSKFKEIFRYLNDFANSLNVVNPAVLRRYYVESTSTLENLKQSEYKVNKRIKTINNHDYIEEVVIRFRCSSDAPLVLEKKSQRVVQRFREHLWGYNLKFDCKEVRNNRGYVESAVFTIASEVPCLMVFSADIERQRIKIYIKNLENLGDISYEYNLDEINPEFMEELSKYVLAKPSKFRSLANYQPPVSPPRNTSPVSSTPVTNQT